MAGDSARILCSANRQQTSNTATAGKRNMMETKSTNGNKRLSARLPVLVSQKAANRFWQFAFDAAVPIS